MNRRIHAPTQFLNRELGILAFNRRVLAQAADESVPLLERLRFITIVSSNLDEFFEIRVAGLKESIKLGLAEPTPDGRSPADVFEAVGREAHELVAEQYRLLNAVVLPALAEQGIVFPRREAHARHQLHVDHDVRGVRQLDADLRDVRADGSHRERHDVHGAAAHAAVEQAPERAAHLGRGDPVVGWPGVVFAG